MVTSKRVDVFLEKSRTWSQEYSALRKLALATGAEETLKWGWPCYTMDGKNVFLIHGFKDYCAIAFFKGSLMKDSKKLLVQQTANVQATRQMRFTGLSDITKKQASITSYMKQAIALEESGAKVEMKASKGLSIPKEVNLALGTVPGLPTAFKKLTPGRQRAYVLFFTSAKLEKTLHDRMKKSAPKIRAGKGPTER
jgi:uncharacterized protein YdeI (YjbR/CyaY-like superfamily)